VRQANKFMGEDFGKWDGVVNWRGEFFYGVIWWQYPKLQLRIYLKSSLSAL
jgi:hypothetical protein